MGGDPPSIYLPRLWRSLAQKFDDWFGRCLPEIWRVIDKLNRRYSASSSATTQQYESALLCQFFGDRLIIKFGNSLPGFRQLINDKTWQSSAETLAIILAIDIGNSLPILWQ